MPRDKVTDYTEFDDEEPFESDDILDDELSEDDDTEDYLENTTQTLGEAIGVDDDYIDEYH